MAKPVTPPTGSARCVRPARVPSLARRRRRDVTSIRRRCARKAFPAWSACQQRACTLARTMADALEAHLEAFASAERGRRQAIAGPRCRIPPARSATALLRPTRTPVRQRSHHARPASIHLRRPLGVVGLHQSWNLPLPVTWDRAALAAQYGGGQAVRGPPRSATMLAALARRSDFPRAYHLVNGRGRR